MKAEREVPGAESVQAVACRGGVIGAVQDWVADEVPVALQYNGISHAVMLASPLDLEDFAYGFSLSEGIADSAADLHGVEVEEVEQLSPEDHCALPSDGRASTSPEGLVLQIEIASRCLARLKERRRTLAGRTGCGLCGTDSLEQALPRIGRTVTSVEVTMGALARALSGLRELQVLQAMTGATHAAAWCSLEGDVRLLREDVGRHNALDKLIGALARSRTDATAGFFAVTSRASYEMVQKTARAGVGLLAAISAPTALAIRTADEAGLSLIGFARGTEWVAYSHADRLIP